MGRGGPGGRRDPLPAPSGEKEREMPVSAEEVPIKTTAHHVPLHGVNRATANKTNRSIKIARPKCDECEEAYNPKGRNPVWWKKCLANGHNPYVRFRERTALEKRYEVREDGAKVLAGEEEVVYLDLVLNLGSVTQSYDSSSGLGFEKATILHGALPLEDLGYGYRCEMQGCAVPAKFSCQFGNYCSDQHARLVGYDEDVRVHEVYDQKKRNQQLSGVQIVRREITQPKMPGRPKKEAAA